MTARRKAPAAPRRAPGVAAAVRRDLRRLPKDLQDGADAAVAIELAKTIDQGLQVGPASKQLVALMAELRERAAKDKPAAPQPVDEPVVSKGAGIGDLSARIAARRGAAAG